MRCKIVRFQKLMWRNMMRLTKSQKASVLYYSIDITGECFNLHPLPPYSSKSLHALFFLFKYTNRNSRLYNFPTKKLGIFTDKILMEVWRDSLVRWERGRKWEKILKTMMFVWLLLRSPIKLPELSFSFSVEVRKSFKKH